MPTELSVEELPEPLTPCPATFASLVKDFHALGLQSADAVFVHSSLRSLGPLAGGAETVIRSLETAVAPNGVVLMPSFNLIEQPLRAKSWNLATTPATTGWISEVFRRMPGTVRSDHYSHSVAVRGPQAKMWIERSTAKKEDLRSPWDLAPWGNPFGRHSPIFQCYHQGAKVLLLGTGYHALTFLHLLEVLDWNRRMTEEPSAEFRWIDREAAGRWWEGHTGQEHSLVARAHCTFFEVRKFIDTLLDFVRTDSSLFKSWPSPQPSQT